MLEEIRVKKAAQHNLKQIDVNLPRNRFIVITGPSGSGKSSLAFDTLFAEGQRRYIECLSAYARQYIEQLEKPEVESIEGISPSISIDQKTISFNPRSTVGTVTETYDFLRLLFARAGTPHCPRCDRIVNSQTPQEIVRRILDASGGERIKVLAPVVKGRKGEYLRLFERFRKKGFLRARVDGQLRDLDEEIVLERNRNHSIEILVDEVLSAPESPGRLQEAVEAALELAESDVLVLRASEEEMYYSLNLLCPFCEISLPELEPRAFSFNSPYGACPTCHGLGFRTRLNQRGDYEVTDEPCPACGGSRLRRESLAVKVGGSNIHGLSSLPVSRLIETFDTFSFVKIFQPVVSRIRKEILSRLLVIQELGMGYLQLSRTTASLSGGEARRIRLAAQVGVNLRGVLYVLDEPTIGLHQRDNDRLISMLKRIRDQGNSVVVVEHDEQTIRAADYILDLGPGAGEKGGEKVAEGDQDIDVRFPLSVMTVVTGVSGSGKSTLIYDILYWSLAELLHKARHRVGDHRRILGVEQIDKVIAVDQKPIGRTPRSNPATFTGLFTPLRQLFARSQESRIRGYTASRFSFNLRGGRCEECQGAGARKIEMHFLPDVFVTCDRCGGTRYNKETLAVRFKGQNIADYLAMTVDEAYDTLKAHPTLRKKLGLLKQVGLGYLRLGQPAPTLSGGEAQRIKLTKELSRTNTGRTLYLLDEPTTGLHFDDVRKLLDVLSILVELGNTVIIIEHNLEVMKFCDYIIDLGPEGGERGGHVVASGTPEEVCRENVSYTGRFLSKALAQAGHDDT
jgi:excinuclease ABC subunit A